MGRFDAVIQALMLLVIHAMKHLLESSLIATKFICNEHMWGLLISTSQFLEETQSRRFLTSAVHEDAGNIAELVNRSV